jgi:hypothetical protein
MDNDALAVLRAEVETIASQLRETNDFVLVKILLVELRRTLEKLDGDEMHLAMAAHS